MRELPERKQIRLRDYDYSQAGCYFITICAKNRECLFGDIVGGEMLPNEYGMIAKSEIERISTRYDNVSIGGYVIMPNHVHLIVRINPSERINPFPTKVADIPNIIGKYKAGVTRIVGNAFMRSAKRAIWQGRYHDHIIRNEKSYQEIAEYIENNPMRWELDCHNPQNHKYNDWNDNND